jgi:formylglycine-generating enzyme required for sulfatase activity
MRKGLRLIFLFAIISAIGLWGQTATFESNNGTKQPVPNAGDVETIGGIEFVYIPAGNFILGSPDGEGNDNEHPRHRIELNGFWIGKYEVTQTQWSNVLGRNPSYRKGNDMPVEKVSWNDCQEFCRKFNTKYGANIRFPTEAEWEYAYRAGSTTKYYWGNSIDGDYTWHSGNSDNQTHPVGQKKPNNWGLYDMTGNVWEWCQDWFKDDYYAISPVNNPECTNNNNGNKILRGGSYFNNDDYCRSSFRNYGPPSLIRPVIGFRPAK